MGGRHGQRSGEPGWEAWPAPLYVIVPLAGLTLIALIVLWPAPVPTSGQAAPGMERVTGTIAEITSTPCPEAPAVEGAPAGGQETDPGECGRAQVELTGGSAAGESVTTDLPTGPGPHGYDPGDRVVLMSMPAAPGGPEAAAAPAYQIVDHDRSTPLAVWGVAFALAVIAFGRWRGVMSLIGLAVTFVLLLMFIIPAILAGQPPLLVAVVGSTAIMLVVLYLTHGFALSTSMAVIGTLSSLCLTGLLSLAAIGMTELNGITDESSFYLDMSHQINTQGLLLASIIIGSLGVLDDVTVTQAATVTELARANPSYGFRRLYQAASRVGRAHIASVINTIILAYAGASLPLLLLINVSAQPLGEVLANPVFGQEIVRAVAGTLGLIAAVPITTALTALAVTRSAAAASGRDRAAEAPAVAAADAGTP
ncbi:YibE/F family protein [Allonocardiopsis opalescens]|uniref:YibE/F-like protein n=1 Tax=Allonocardiopsis opalescens TaxID=1144618 RepID=A0A2T0Q2D7_9ACTN|nr:YibE/F family protein [Allonocardiopsis opalescens]PRX97955.1 YibE/F-like protein [Allonocardiopsis opalescens]